MNVSPIPERRRKKVRRALEVELRRLERRMGATDERFGPAELDACAVGRAPESQDLERIAIARSLREREHEQLAELQRALRRLDDGVYGRCTTCGGEIAQERLDVFPAAARCSACSRDAPGGA